MEPLDLTLQLADLQSNTLHLYSIIKVIKIKKKKRIKERSIETESSKDLMGKALITSTIILE